MSIRSYKKSGIVYYAHSIQIYDSKEEILVRNLLKRNFKKVICPNRDLLKNQSMDYYYHTLLKCNLIIATEYLEHIGMGVHMLLDFALAHGIPAYWLKFSNGKPIFEIIKRVEIVNAKQVSIFYSKIISV